MIVATHLKCMRHEKHLDWFQWLDACVHDAQLHTYTESLIDPLIKRWHNLRTKNLLWSLVSNCDIVNQKNMISTFANTATFFTGQHAINYSKKMQKITLECMHASRAGTYMHNLKSNDNQKSSMDRPPLIGHHDEVIWRKWYFSFLTKYENWHKCRTYIDMHVYIHTRKYDNFKLRKRNKLSYTLPNGNML